MMFSRAKDKKSEPTMCSLSYYITLNGQCTPHKTYLAT